MGKIFQTALLMRKLNKRTIRAILTIMRYRVVCLKLINTKLSYKIFWTWNIHDLWYNDWFSMISVQLYSVLHWSVPAWQQLSELKLVVSAGNYVYHYSSESHDLTFIILYTCKHDLYILQARSSLTSEWYI